MPSPHHQDQVRRCWSWQWNGMWLAVTIMSGVVSVCTCAHLSAAAEWKEKGGSQGESKHALRDVPQKKALRNMNQSALKRRKDIVNVQVGCLRTAICVSCENPQRTPGVASASNCWMMGCGNVCGGLVVSFSFVPLAPQQMINSFLFSILNLASPSLRHFAPILSTTRPFFHSVSTTHHHLTGMTMGTGWLGGYSDKHSQRDNGSQLIPPHSAPLFFQLQFHIRSTMQTNFFFYFTGRKIGDEIPVFIVPHFFNWCWSDGDHHHIDLVYFIIFNPFFVVHQFDSQLTGCDYLVIPLIVCRNSWCPRMVAGNPSAKITCTYFISIPCQLILKLIGTAKLSVVVEIRSQHSLIG